VLLWSYQETNEEEAMNRISDQEFYTEEQLALIEQARSGELNGRRVEFETERGTRVGKIQGFDSWSRIGRTGPNSLGHVGWVYAVTVNYRNGFYPVEITDLRLV
jgi:hypothetical protein